MKKKKINARTSRFAEGRPDTDGPIRVASLVKGKALIHKTMKQHAELFRRLSE